MKILYDLKPALDGYAGIPQETRLLFSGLRGLGDRFEVDGLLQHEHERLFADDGDDRALAPHERIDRASRTVVSFFSEPAGGRLHRYVRKLRQLKALEALRWQALAGRPVRLGRFDGAPFEDFLWTRLFDKTLGVEHKAAVTGGLYRVAPPPRGLMQLAGLKSALPLARPRYLGLDTADYDFLLTQTPFPARVSPATRLVVRYHDAVPLLMPHTIGAKAFHQASHFRSLKANVEDGALFACNSQATRDDLLRVFPDAGDRASVIHNMISDEFAPDAFPAEAALSIIASRSVAGESRPHEPPRDYLLMVSTLEPRKNHALLVSAWERLRREAMPDLALVLVGSKGWDFEPIEDVIRPWIGRGRIFHLSNVPASELRTLYRHARATVCPSRGEGFGYSGIEAMASGGLVVSSDIAVHREVYADASAYFDPYSAQDAASALARLLHADGQGERDALLRASAAVVERYRPAAILPRWQAFFERQGGAR